MLRKTRTITILLLLISALSILMMPVFAEEEEVVPIALNGESGSCLKSHGREICTYTATNDTAATIYNAVIETEIGLTVAWDVCGRLAQPIEIDETISCSIIVSGEREWTPEIESLSSADTVVVGDTFTVSISASDVISSNFYVGVGELILASVENGVVSGSETGGAIGAVDIDAVIVDPADGESVDFVIRVINSDYGVSVNPFVYGHTLRDGQIKFTSMGSDAITVDVVELPVVEPPINNPFDFDSTIDEQIDYREWVQIAADTIGVTVADLTDSTDAIRTIARANGIAPRDVINAIFAPEKAALKAVKNEGRITAEMYRARKSEVKSAIRAFVRTAPIDPTTDVGMQEAQWSTLALNTYTYTLSTSCFCYGLLDYTISVVDDVVVNVTAAPMFPDDPVYEEMGYDPNPDPADFRTFDDWFVYVLERSANEPYYLNAQYDAVYGHLTSVYVDENPMIADEEIGYTITLLP